MAESQHECRICFQTDLASQMIAPCLCAGSLQFVHADCLDEWCVLSCELSFYSYFLIDFNLV